jgi:hypothetical protein
LTLPRDALDPVAADQVRLHVASLAAPLPAIRRTRTHGSACLGRSPTMRLPTPAAGPPHRARSAREVHLADPCRVRDLGLDRRHGVVHADQAWHRRPRATTDRRTGTHPARARPRARPRRGRSEDASASIDSRSSTSRRPPGASTPPAGEHAGGVVQMREEQARVQQVGGRERQVGTDHVGDHEYRVRSRTVHDGRTRRSSRSRRSSRPPSWPARGRWSHPDRSPDRGRDEAVAATRRAGTPC